MASDSPLYIGTCGFSYPEWISAGIYPSGTKSAQMLSLYSRLLPLVELNYTWYQMVRAEAMERMLAANTATLLFCAKLTRTMTHEIADNWQDQVNQYLHGIRPLVQSNRLLAVLVQLPPSFRRTPENRYYLAHLLDALQALPLAVEFRHLSWMHDSVFQALEQRRITLVSVDAPPLPDLFPALDIITNPDFFYLRLHGRNLQGWNSGSKQQQFDYNYTHDELSEWSEKRIPEMRSVCSKGIILFNNHVAGQAVRNAQAMADLLS